MLFEQKSNKIKIQNYLKMALMLYLTGFSTASRGKLLIGVVYHPLREIGKS